MSAAMKHHHHPTRHAHVPREAYADLAFAVERLLRDGENTEDGEEAEGDEQNQKESVRATSVIDLQYQAIYQSLEVALQNASPRKHMLRIHLLQTCSTPEQPLKNPYRNETKKTQGSVWWHNSSVSTRTWRGVAGCYLGHSNSRVLSISNALRCKNRTTLRFNCGNTNISMCRRAS